MKHWIVDYSIKYRTGDVAVEELTIKVEAENITIALGKALQYCSTDCSNERNKIEERKKGQALIKKVCSICGEEFRVKKTSTRELCLDCKHMTKRGYSEKPKVNNSARAEKMRKIKESGMTYGQYMANKGIKPEEPEVYKGTLTETQSWMPGSGTVQVHPDVVQDPPKARLRRKVI